MSKEDIATFVVAPCEFYNARPFVARGDRPHELPLGGRCARGAWRQQLGLDDSGGLERQRVLLVRESTALLAPEVRCPFPDRHLHGEEHGIEGSVADLQVVSHRSLLRQQGPAARPGPAPRVSERGATGPGPLLQGEACRSESRSRVNAARSRCHSGTSPRRLPRLASAGSVQRLPYHRRCHGLGLARLNPRYRSWPCNGVDYPDGPFQVELGEVLLAQHRSKFCLQLALANVLSRAGEVSTGAVPGT